MHGKIGNVVETEITETNVTFFETNPSGRVFLTSFVRFNPSIYVPFDTKNVKDFVYYCYENKNKNWFLWQNFITECGVVGEFTYNGNKIRKIFYI